MRGPLMRQVFKRQCVLRRGIHAAVAGFVVLGFASVGMGDVVEMVQLERAAQLQGGRMALSIVMGPAMGSSTQPADDRSFNIAMGDDSNVRRKLEDFNDLLTAKKWMQAFSVLEQISSITPAPMVQTGDGLIAPFPAYRRNLLENMPADARKAFAVMFDPKAKSLWDAAQDTSPEREIELLEQVVSVYPLTESASAASSRLGEAYFEAGQFGRAIDVWATRLPDDTTPPAEAATQWFRLAVAAHRARDLRVLRHSQEQIERHYSDVKIRLGREQMPAGAALKAAIKGDEVRAATDVPVPKFKLPRRVTGKMVVEVVPAPIMQQIITRSMQRGMGDMAITNLVNVAVVNDRLLAAAPGWRAAFEDGKAEPVWQIGNAQNSASQLERLIRYQIDGRETLSNLDGLVVQTSTDPNRGTYTQLSVVDPTNGSEKWSTPMDGNTIALGAHMRQDDSLYSVMLSSSGAALTLHSYSADTGASQFTLPLGSSMTYASRGHYAPIKPAITADATHIYVQTNDGAVIAIDRERQSMSWALKYDVTIPQQVVQGNYQTLAMLPHGNIGMHDNLLITKDRMSNLLMAIDVQRKQVRWKQDIGQSSGLVGIRHGLAIVTDGGISAYDVATGKRVWWSELANTRSASVLLTDDLIVAVDRERIYAFSLRTGKVMAFSEVEGMESQPGNLALHDGTLYIVDGMRVMSFELHEPQNKKPADPQPNDGR